MGDHEVLSSIESVPPVTAHPASGWCAAVASAVSEVVSRGASGASRDKDAVAEPPALKKKLQKVLDDFRFHRDGG